MDRALDYESRGQGFESSRARQFNVSLIIKNKDLIKKLILIDFNFKSGGTYGGT